MSTARSIVEWVAFATLRLAAMCSTMAGLAVIAAALAVQAAGSDAEWARAIVGSSFAMAMALLLAGGVSLYLVRAATAWLPDDPRTHASTGSAISGWLLLFPLTLIAAPALMLVQLRPLAEFWRDVVALADQLNIWPDLQRSAAAGGMGGIVFLPIIAALAAPSLETLAAAAGVLGSALLIALLLVDSPRVVRALLLCAILQGALVMASAFGAVVVERVVPSVEALVRETPDPGGIERDRALAELQRYSVVVRRSSGTLAWAWGATALWVPLLLVAQRGRKPLTAASSSADGSPGRPTSAVTMPFSAMDADARARAYREAAQQVDRSTRPSRWF